MKRRIVTGQTHHMTISKKEWRQMRIMQKAKDLAFAELDKHDQKMYLAEAEKAINKADRALYGTELDFIPEDEDEEDK